jgi:hypothetical protein
VYLNGRQIYQCRLSNRPLWALDTVGPVALKQGVNVLLFKVVNDAGAWEGCAPLVDDAGRPAGPEHPREADAVSGAAKSRTATAPTTICCGARPRPSSRIGPFRPTRSPAENPPS